MANNHLQKHKYSDNQTTKHTSNTHTHTHEEVTDNVQSACTTTADCASLEVLKIKW